MKVASAVADAEPQLLDPARCAVVVIDIQNDFCHEAGALARLGHDISETAAAVDHIGDLLDMAREAGVPRIYVRTVHSHWFDTPAWAARGWNSKRNTDEVQVVAEGTWGAEFYELQPADDELVLTKHRYSAFAYTPLELALRSKGRETMVLAGTKTNVCVEASARDGLSRGFFPVLAYECAATAPSLQPGTVEQFATHIGAALDLGRIRAVWHRAIAGNSTRLRAARCSRQSD